MTEPQTTPLTAEEALAEAVSDSLASSTMGTDYAEAPEPSDEPGSPYVMRLTHELMARGVARQPAPSEGLREAAERRIAELTVEQRLAEVYRHDSTAALWVARICDEALDRSGGLLGRVRALARQPAPSEGLDEHDVERERVFADLDRRRAEYTSGQAALATQSRTAVGAENATERRQPAPSEGHLTAGQLVDRQAEDEGLWFIAVTAAEAYLQQELRRLHAAVEADVLRAALSASTESGRGLDVEAIAAEYARSSPAPDTAEEGK